MKHGAPGKKLVNPLQGNMSTSMSSSEKLPVSKHKMVIKHPGFCPYFHLATDGNFLASYLSLSKGQGPKGTSRQETSSPEIQENFQDPGPVVSWMLGPHKDSWESAFQHHYHSSQTFAGRSKYPQVVYSNDIFSLIRMSPS